jgi:4-hydroxyacetophenone monooxygenase
MHGGKLLPLPDDVAEIDAALVDMEPVPLIAAVAHLTGDLGLLRPELRPNPALLREPNSGFTPEQIALTRELCLAAILRFRDDQRSVAKKPDAREIRRIMEFVTGVDVDDRYVPLLTEELAVEGVDLRAPDWTMASVAPSRDFEVVIVGAGMSGIAAGFRLKQAGVSFRIFEKSEAVGGTWHDNTYPGCRVDIQNHMYSYSFAQRPDWPSYFSPRKVLAEYFEQCAEDFGVTPNISFRHEVGAMRWDEGRQLWEIDVTGPDGIRTVTANAVVSAVGQLNRPRMPEIEGVGTFDGPAFHTAKWDDSVDLRKKRVIIIGTGASACQVIPAIAGDVSHLTVFQRTAPWMLPAPNYFKEVLPGLRWLFERVPFYAQWYRLWLFWRGIETMQPFAIVEPDFPPTETSVGRANEEIRQLLTMWIQLLTDGDEDLGAKLTPDYPPFAKRFVVDDGSLVMTYRQPHVDLVTTSIQRIEKKGVRTVDGVLHEADVLIYGTGFAASDFLVPMSVVGRNGADLHREWNGDARAYLGITVPHFPNFFLLYGPNTNIVVNGSIIYYSECEVNYLLESIRFMLENDVSSLDVKTVVHDAYNEKIDAANKLRTWGFSKVRSWYKNSHGRTAQNWPFNVLEYWEQTRVLNPDDYELGRSSLVDH